MDSTSDLNFDNLVTNFHNIFLKFQSKPKNDECAMIQPCAIDSTEMTASLIRKLKDETWLSCYALETEIREMFDNLHSFLPEDYLLSDEVQV